MAGDFLLTGKKIAPGVFAGSRMFIASIVEYIAVVVISVAAFR